MKRYNITFLKGTQVPRRVIRTWGRLSQGLVAAMLLHALVLVGLLPLLADRKAQMAEAPVMTIQLVSALEPPAPVVEAAPQAVAAAPEVAIAAPEAATVAPEIVPAAPDIQIPAPEPPPVVETPTPPPPILDVPRPAPVAVSHATIKPPPTPPKPLVPARRPTAAPASAPNAPPTPSVAPAAPAPQPPPSPAARDAWQQALSAWLGQHKIYPETARRRGIEGEVTVRFTIDRAGRVLSVTILRSSGATELDAAAEATLRDAIVPAPATMADDSTSVTVTLRYALTR